jgi:hypothetical protein
LPKLKENFNKSLKNLRKMVCWTLEVVISPSFQAGGWGPGLRASGRDWPEAHPDKSWKPSKKPADHFFYLRKTSTKHMYIYIIIHIYIYRAGILFAAPGETSFTSQKEHGFRSLSSGENGFVRTCSILLL